MPLRNERGLTLIEALAAMVVLGFVVVGLLHITGYASLASVRSANEADALRIAEEQLAIVRETARASGALPNVRVYSVGGYAVTVQDSLLNQVTYNATTFGPKHLSLQAHALIGGAPRVVTVTVSWGSSP